MADSVLRVRVFDGSRQEVAGAVPVLITIMDGHSKIVFRGDKPSGTAFTVPFFDTPLGDNYTVVAFRDRYEQAGLTPVACSPALPQTVDLMLLKKDSGYNFSAAKWETLKSWNEKAAELLTGGVTEAVAQKRDRKSTRLNSSH